MKNFAMGLTLIVDVFISVFLASTVLCTIEGKILSVPPFFIFSFGVIWIIAKVATLAGEAESDCAIEENKNKKEKI